MKRVEEHNFTRTKFLAAIAVGVVGGSLWHLGEVNYETSKGKLLANFTKELYENFPKNEAQDFENQLKNALDKKEESTLSFKVQKDSFNVIFNKDKYQEFTKDLEFKEAKNDSIVIELKYTPQMLEHLQKALEFYEEKLELFSNEPEMLLNETLKKVGFSKELSNVLSEVYEPNLKIQQVDIESAKAFDFSQKK